MLYIAVYRVTKKRSVQLNKTLFELEAATRFELVVAVLQTAALPLGYAAVFRAIVARLVKFGKLACQRIAGKRSFWYTAPL